MIDQRTLMQMKHCEYTPSGVCARKIEFDLDGDIVRNVCFQGGCNGNLKAISKLVEGMTAQQISEKLKGNTCGAKKTSCADQLTIAISENL